MLPLKPISFVKSCEEIFYNMYQPLSKQPVKWYVNVAIKVHHGFLKSLEKIQGEKTQLSAKFNCIDEAIIGNIHSH